MNEINNQLYIDSLLKLKQDNEFYGTINYIDKSEHQFKIYIDLFNQTTDEIDDFLFSGQLNDLCYSFDLVIETQGLSILGHSHELFKFTVIDEIENNFDTFKGTISFLTHHRYDQVNPYPELTLTFKVNKVTLHEKLAYKNRIETHLNHVNQFMTVTEKYEIDDYGKEYHPKLGVLYSQYHVGIGNSSYINIGGVSKGFFNIGFSNKKNGKNVYTGFSRHKPDWIILSHLNKTCYNAAIRYGNNLIYSCIWLLPSVIKYNMNLIRLLYCIHNSGGKVVMLKYKSNSSVCSLIQDQVKLEVYYTTDYDSNRNGLSLYIENEDKFISFGNSDYNFLTKSVVKQRFDLIVVPFQGSKMKTKIHFNKPLENDELYTRNGFHIHRTDLLGNFFCKL